MNVKPSLIPDFPRCQESSTEVRRVAAARTSEMHGMEPNISDLATRIGQDMVAQIAAYKEAGAVTDDIAGWLAGTFSTRQGRDFSIVGLAGTATDKRSIFEYLVGDRVIEDPGLLADGQSMLFESLALISGPARPNIFCGLVWTHWTSGRIIEASAALIEALKLDREHPLANLLSEFIATGKVSATAQQELAKRNQAALLN